MWGWFGIGRTTEPTRHRGRLDWVVALSRGHTAAMVIGGLVMYLAAVSIAHGAPRLGVSLRAPTTAPANRRVALTPRVRLTRGTRVIRFRLSLGDGSTIRGAMPPRTLTHVYRRSGRFVIVFSVRDSRGQNWRTRLVIRILTQSHHSPPQHRHGMTSAPMWVSLPGPVISNNDSVLLIQPEGDVGYVLIGTRTSEDVRIDPRAALPARTALDGPGLLGETGFSETAYVTPPVGGHADGLVAVVLSATTEAIGLQPVVDRDYLIYYDAGDGRLVSAAPITAPSNWPIPIYLPELIGYSEDHLTVYLAGGPMANTEPSGSFLARIAASGGVTASVMASISGILGSTPSDALVDSGSSNCPAVAVFNLLTLQEVSHSPCGWDGVYHTGFFDGTAYTVSGLPAVYSAANGAALTGSGELGPGAYLYSITGPRSSIVVTWHHGFPYSAPAQVLARANWQPVLTVNNTEALTFDVEGVADNDVWVDSGGRQVVINGMTGAELYAGYRVVPLTGGIGWTLVRGPQPVAGRATEYLLRSDGTLLTSLGRAP
jgi:hypothetical protein